MWTTRTLRAYIEWRLQALTNVLCDLCWLFTQAQCETDRHVSVHYLHRKQRKSQITRSHSLISTPTHFNCRHPACNLHAHRYKGCVALHARSAMTRTTSRWRVLTAWLSSRICCAHSTRFAITRDGHFETHRTHGQDQIKVVALWLRYRSTKQKY